MAQSALRHCGPWRDILAEGCVRSGLSPPATHAWDQFMTLPWPDKLALKLVNFVPGAVSLKPNNPA